MITTSAREIVAALENVIPFASPDADDPAYNVVRIDFDGDDLHTSASNRSQHVRYRVDVEETGDADDSPSSWQYGLSAEAHPFSVRIDLQQAKAIAASLKMKPAKLMFAPVTLKVVPDLEERNMFKVKFIRDGNDPLWTPLAFHASGHGRPIEEDGDAPEVDIDELIRRVAPLKATSDRVAFNAKQLANFAKVVAYGPTEFEFTAGAEQAMRVKIGKRFQGVVWPSKLDRPAPME